MYRRISSSAISARARRPSLWGGIQLPRFLIDHAQRPEGMAIGAAQRAAGIEDDVFMAGHERVIAEAIIVARILDGEQIVAQDGVAAEGPRARRFGHGRAPVRFEPLAVRREQGDQRNRRTRDEAGQPRDAIERGLRRGIEQPRARDGAKAARLVLRRGIIGGAFRPQLG
jgi:hypothetical protein